MEVTAPLLPFVFVGCWNREGPHGAREAVARAIQNTNVPTVILGGDNIYPPYTVDPDTGKEKKGDDYNLNAFRRGAELYSTIPRLFVAVGNHNIDYPAPLDIYYEEQQTFGTSLPSSYYSRTFSDGYSIVVIDTNLVEAKYADAFARMIEWLRGVSVGRYFLIQHEPFVAFSKLKEKAGVKIKQIPVLKRGHEILAALTEPPIAILCADVHNYQVGEITYREKNGDEGYTIPQYVVGTGGAAPDRMFALDGKHDYTTPDGKITYKLQDTREGYGFLTVRRSSAENARRIPEVLPEKNYTQISDMTFIFRRVMSWPAMGGRRRTRRSKRTKSRHRVRGQ